MSELPKCSACNQVARPNILMFDDPSWLSERTDIQGKRMRKQLEKIKNPVVIECGAGTAIPSVRYFCESVGGKLVRINPVEADVPRGGIGIQANALAALEVLNFTLKTLGFFK